MGGLFFLFSGGGANGLMPLAPPPAKSYCPFRVNSGIVAILATYLFDFSRFLTLGGRETRPSQAPAEGNIF
jgi:hypothetical protein